MTKSNNPLKHIAPVSGCFRFGVMLNSFQLECWQVRTIELLLNEGHEAVVFFLPKSKTEQIGLRQRMTNYPWRRLFFRLWHRFIFKPEAKKTRDIRQLAPTVSMRYLETVSKKGVTYINDNEVDAIQSYSLDFILRFGFNILRGPVLRAAKYGVWSFHHDDEREIRGGPPGFWEVYHGKLTNGIILQQLTDELDKGLIINRYKLNVVQHSYKEHLNRLYFESAQMPAQHCRKLLLQPDFQPDASVSEAAILHPPSNLKMLVFWMKMLYRRLRFHVDFLFRHEDWHLGYLRMPLQIFALEPEKYLPQIQWVKRKIRSAYLADPFVIETAQGEKILAEYFDYESGKGSIVMLDPDDKSGIYSTVLQSRNHFSFPGLLRWEGEIYCLPESHQSGEIRLYRWDEKKCSMLEDRMLLNGVAAVDPVLFQHGQLWWLMFTERSMPSVHLYAYYASHPFGPFVPHNLNPVKSDISSSRNAGYPLIINGMLIRPAQDCSGQYGKAVNLQQIHRLDPTHFEESHWKRIEPVSGSPYDMGLHHLSGNSNLTVIDGKRFTFSIAGFVNQWKLKTKKR